ncbi:MAG: hypothetical protein IJ740_03350 [Ruminococcus sp.]|nr:hypothetical protein [Ruminococcus sp.]
MEPRISVIKPKRACEILKEHGMSITEVKLDMGLRQKVFPFGDAIEMQSEWDYIIYEHLLMEWISERDGSPKEASILKMLQKLLKMIKVEVKE